MNNVLYGNGEPNGILQPFVSTRHELAVGFAVAPRKTDINNSSSIHRMERRIMAVTLSERNVYNEVKNDIEYRTQGYSLQ